MDIDQFWDIIDRARAAAGPAADQAIRDYDTPDDDPNRDYWDFDDLELDRELLAGVMKGDPTALATLEASLDAEEAEGDDEDDEESDDLEETQEIDDPIASALVAQLAQLPAAEIAAFEQIFEELRAKADRDDIANAAILIEHGFLGDESFDDFRAGLVALGRTAFDAALANPDSLAENPVVREIAQANDPRWLGREDLLYVASSAYAMVTGEAEVDFYDFVEAQFPEGLAEAPDVEEDDWTVTDEPATRERLPKLATLFYERSMRNRARAMEKLGLDAE